MRSRRRSPARRTAWSFLLVTCFMKSCWQKMRIFFGYVLHSFGKNVTLVSPLERTLLSGTKPGIFSYPLLAEEQSHN